MPPSRAIQPPYTNSLPEIRASLLANPGFANSIKIPCRLCDQNVSIDRSSEAPNQCPGLIVLPCGCCFGDRCWRKFAAEWGARLPVRCAYCGRGLSHRSPDCGHDVYPFPINTLQDINRVPKLLSEGATISSQCIACMWASQIHALTVEIQELMPEEIKWDCEHGLILSLKTNWKGMIINLRVMLMGMDRRGLWRVDISGPIRNFDEDYSVLYDGTPCRTFPCEMLRIMRRNIRMVYDLQDESGEWAPRITSMEFGIENECDDETLGRMREFFANVHMMSLGYEQYLGDLARQVRSHLPYLRRLHGRYMGLGTRPNSPGHESRASEPPPEVQEVDDARRGHRVGVDLQEMQDWAARGPDESDDDSEVDR